MRVLGFAGYSGSGKTTLIEKLIPILVADGRQVAVIKHTHHDFEVDQAGKDSHRHRIAGATEVLVSSPHRWALIHESRAGNEPSLTEQIARLSPCDLVLVEGFKAEPIPKIEIHRTDDERPLLATDDPWVIAIASDGALDCTPWVRLNLNAPEGIARFILDWIERT